MKNNNKKSRKRLTWLIVIRVILVTLFLSIGTLIFKSDKNFFYAIIASVYLFSIVYLIWFSIGRFLKALIAAQLFLDCFFISLIVLFTGSTESVFTGLYLLVILAASMTVSPVAGMVTTGLASVLYSLQLYVAYTDIFPWFARPVYEANGVLTLYSAHVHIVTFILVGILSSFLARTIFKMEATLKERERVAMMGEAAAQIAHEIRNPLAAVSGSVELLKESLLSTLTDKNRQLMDAVISETERVSNIFDEFLDLSRIDNLQKEVVSIKKILSEVIFLIENNKSFKGLKLKTDICSDDLVVSCDRNRMKQVFWNLIKNAIEEMRGEGHMVISAEKKGNTAELRFQDEGRGVKAEDVKHLFKPYRSSKSKGLGLGLMISKKIIEKHGGEIRLEMTSTHQGACFVIELPLNQ